MITLLYSWVLPDGYQGELSRDSDRDCGEWFYTLLRHILTKALGRSIYVSAWSQSIYWCMNNLIRHDTFIVLQRNRRFVLPKYHQGPEIDESLRRVCITVGSKSECSLENCLTEENTHTQPRHTSFRDCETRRCELLDAFEKDRSTLTLRYRPLMSNALV